MCLSQRGKLIVAEVGLGNIESVITKDRKRKTPQDDYDSMVVRTWLSEILVDGGD